MTPRRLDLDVVRQKLDAIEGTRRTLEGIGDVSRADLNLDLDIVADVVPRAVKAYGRYVQSVARSVVADPSDDLAP